jgi:hypothetical protein
MQRLVYDEGYKFLDNWISFILQSVSLQIVLLHNPCLYVEFVADNIYSYIDE